MTDYPAITGIDDPSQARVMLLQGKTQVHAPLTGLPVQPLDAGLTDIAGLAVTDGNIIVGNGTNWVAESGATARASLGLGSAATQELTPFVTYTPTFTSFGTVTGISIWSRRVGDTLYVRGKFTAGTVIATEARMTIGFNGTSANVTADATKVPSIQLAGMSIRDTNGASQFVLLIDGGLNILTFGAQAAGSAGLTKQNASAIFASGATISIQAEIPITGW